MIGGLLGVYGLKTVDVHIAKPIVNGYLILLDLSVVYRAFHVVKPKNTASSRQIVPLAFVGGTLDASSGGWGLIVSSSLIAKGYNHRGVIGSVSAAEFFLSFIIGLSLMISVGISSVEYIAALFCRKN